MLSGFALYRTYQALNLHFTSKFDVLKYGQAPKTFTREVFEKRSDKIRFDSFARKIPEDEAFKFCLANFVHNKDKWFYEDLTDQWDVYLSWKKYFDAFAYHFDLEQKIVDDVMRDKDVTMSQMLQETKSGNQPPLLQMLLHGKVTPEYVVTLDHTLKFVGEWNALYKGVDPFVEQKLFVLTKYSKLCYILSKGKRSESPKSRPPQQS